MRRESLSCFGPLNVCQRSRQQSKHESPLYLPNSHSSSLPTTKGQFKEGIPRARNPHPPILEGGILLPTTMDHGSGHRASVSLLESWKEGMETGTPQEIPKFGSPLGDFAIFDSLGRNWGTSTLKPVCSEYVCSTYLVRLPYIKS